MAISELASGFLHTLAKLNPLCPVIVLGTRVISLTGWRSIKEAHLAGCLSASKVAFILLSEIQGRIHIQCDRAAGTDSVFTAI